MILILLDTWIWGFWFGEACVCWALASLLFGYFCNNVAYSPFVRSDGRVIPMTFILFGNIIANVVFQVRLFR